MRNQPDVRHSGPHLRLRIWFPLLRGLLRAEQCSDLLRSKLLRVLDDVAGHGELRRNPMHLRLPDERSQLRSPVRRLPNSRGFSDDLFGERLYREHLFNRVFAVREHL